MCYWDDSSVRLQMHSPNTFCLPLRLSPATITLRGFTEGWKTNQGAFIHNQTISECVSDAAMLIEGII